MKEVLIYFSLNCYLLQFAVLFSTLSIIFGTLFSAQSTTSPGLKNLYWTEILVPIQFLDYTLSNDFTFDDNVWKSYKELESFCQVFRDMPTSLFSNHYSHNILFMFICIFSHFKYKLLSPTFGVYISIYPWYLRIKESNENYFSFSIIKAISFSVSSKESVNLKNHNIHQFFVKFSLNIYFQVESL